jgi:hypothetical protein
MKKLKLLIALNLLTSILIFTSCKKDDTAPDNQAGPCASVNIQVSTQVTNVNPCGSALGQIAITASGDNNLSYSIDGGQTFQASSLFTGLSIANYSIVVKSGQGCTANATATVSAVSKGPQMSAVQNLIVTRCYPCHNTGGIAFSNADLSTPCSIINKWDRIKARAVDNTPTPMPYSPLPAAEKAIITAWVNGGHGYEN